MMEPKYRIHKLPEGRWSFSKRDKVWKHSEDLSLLHTRWFELTSASFGQPEFRKLIQKRVIPSDAGEILREWGPWSIPVASIPIKRFVELRNKYESDDWWKRARAEFSDWSSPMLNLKRAYWIYSKRKHGAPYPEALITNDKWVSPQNIKGSWWIGGVQFPEHLGGLRVDIPPRFRYQEMRSLPAEPEEDRPMRILSSLLGFYINEGLRDVALTFRFDQESGAYLYGGAGILTLENACWLVLRDMAASLSGLRVCAAPGCGKPLSPSRRKDAKTCDKDSCRKAVQRKKRKVANAQGA